MSSSSPPNILGPVVASLQVIGDDRWHEEPQHGPDDLQARVLVASAAPSPILSRLARHGLCQADRLDDRAADNLSRSRVDLVFVLAHGAATLAPAARAVRKAQDTGALTLVGFAPAASESVPEMHTLGQDLGCPVVLCDPALGPAGLADLAAAPIESIGVHGLIGIDFADLCRLTDGCSSGLFTEVALPAPVAGDLTELTRFLGSRLPAEATRLWLHLRGGPKWKLSELNRVTDAVARAAHPGAGICLASTIAADLTTLEVCLLALVP